MAKLNGKVALVSGGARGQGEAEVRLFIEEGAKVIIADVLDDAGMALADSLGDMAHYIHLDVSDEDSWKKAMDETVNHFGGLNINNSSPTSFA